ncbi:MAG: ATP phosphoribosyltransferase regulatory subunit [Eubacteriales bacterium]
MSKRLIHTPEGVRDIYGAEYARKLQIEDRLHNTLLSYGYQDIQTPIFEFLDVYGNEIGTTPTNELYKFFDKEGNTLALRPDFTPSMARCAAKYFMDEKEPIRFSYKGKAFTNTSNLQGKLKESTQIGTELIGDDSVEAEAEMISMVIESLLQAGLTEFQVSVGQIDFFKGLCEEIQLTKEIEAMVRDYISNKNYFAAEELLIHEQVPKSAIHKLLRVGDLIGTYEILDEGEALVTNLRSKGAIKRLKDLYNVLKAYGIQRYVSFDLGMLSQYHYYTGVIFKVYTYGVGDVIVKGGRYDNLLIQFGKDAAAIGFVILVDDFMQALSRQKIEVPLKNNNILIVYKKDNFTKALEQAKFLRGSGKNVTLIQWKLESTKENMENFASRTLQNDIIFMIE